MNTATIINSEDLNEIKVSLSKVNSNKNYKNLNGDASPAINAKIAKKIAVKYAEDNKSTLVPVENKTFYMFSNTGNTICIKTRRNLYNASGNFTFTEEDLTADYVAVYSWDSFQKKGFWFMCSSINIKNYINKYVPMKRSYYIIPEKIIEEHAIKKFIYVA